MMAGFSSSANDAVSQTDASLQGEQTTMLPLSNLILDEFGAECAAHHTYHLPQTSPRSDDNDTQLFKEEFEPNGIDSNLARPVGAPPAMTDFSAHVQTKHSSSPAHSDGVKARQGHSNLIEINDRPLGATISTESTSLFDNPNLIRNDTTSGIPAIDPQGPMKGSSSTQDACPEQTPLEQVNSNGSQTDEQLSRHITAKDCVPSAANVANAKLNATPLGMLAKGDQSVPKPSTEQIEKESEYQTASESPVLPPMDLHQSPMSNYMTPYIKEEVAKLTQKSPSAVSDSPPIPENIDLSVLSGKSSGKKSVGETSQWKQESPQNRSRYTTDLLGEFITTDTTERKTRVAMPRNDAVEKAANLRTDSDRLISRKSPPPSVHMHSDLLRGDDSDVSLDEMQAYPLSGRGTASVEKNIRPGSNPELKDYPEFKYERPQANVAERDLEDQEKMTVFVLHNGDVTAVSWNRDVKMADVKEAILCACDAIVNAGLQLRELQTVTKSELETLLKEGGAELGGKLMKVHEKEQGNVWYKRGRIFQFEDFGDLEAGKLYHLERGSDRDDLKCIIGDRKRRLEVPIDALAHCEARKAIARMRFFQLSPDMRRLVWYSGTKRTDETTIAIDTIDEVSVRLHSDQLSNVEFLKQFSFRIITPSQVLDLSGKDEDEFDMWLTGLKALACWTRKQQINKLTLLSHCRRFKQALAANDFGSVDKLEEQPTTEMTLLSSINLAILSEQELKKKESRLRLKLSEIVSKAKTIDPYSLDEENAAGESEHIDVPNTSQNQTPCHIDLMEPYNTEIGDPVFNPSMTDKQMEHKKMFVLLDNAENLLDEAKQRIDSLYKESFPERNKSMKCCVNDTRKASPRQRLQGEIGQLLWKADIDLENLEDIYTRLTSNSTFSVQSTMGK